MTEHAAFAEGLGLLVDPAPPGPERLPMLGVLLEKMARSLATAIRHTTGDAVEVEVGRIVACRFEQFCDEDVPPSVFGIGRIDDWDTRVLVRLDNALLKCAVHAMMGGQRELAPLEANPALSSIDLGFAGQMSGMVMQEVERAFRALTPIDCRHERIERDVRFAVIVQPGTPVIAADFSVVLMGRRGLATLVLPLPALEPVRPLLSQRFVGEQLSHDHQWRDTLEDSVGAVDLTLEIEVAEVATDVARMRAFAVGDVLQLPWDGERVRLSVEQQPLGGARLFHRAGRYALSLDPAEQP